MLVNLGGLGEVTNWPFVYYSKLLEKKSACGIGMALADVGMTTKLYP